jgi:hypothetical protein
VLYKKKRDRPLFSFAGRVSVLFDYGGNGSGIAFQQRCELCAFHCLASLRAHVSLLVSLPILAHIFGAPVPSRPSPGAAAAVFEP